MRTFWQWLRQRVVRLAIRNPGPTTALVFFFLFTVSNHVEFATGMDLALPPLWRMVVTGAVMAIFGAMLLYEVIRLHRKLAEVQMVHTVVSTLHHEINTPLMVIRLSAEKLQDLKSYHEASVRDILAQGTRIRDVVIKLSELDQEVRLHPEPGFQGLIDVARSR